MELINLLKSKIGTDEVISVYCYPDNCNSFLAGHITYVDDDYFLIKCITWNGLYDGFSARKTENVFRVDQATYYENNIKILSTKNQARHIEYVSVDDYCFITNFLTFALNNSFVVSIGVNDSKESNLMGFIKDIDLENNTVSVDQIDDYGNINGFSTITYDSICQLDCDGEREIKFKTLYEMNNSAL